MKIKTEIKTEINEIELKRIVTREYLEECPEQFFKDIDYSMNIAIENSKDKSIKIDGEFEITYRQRVLTIKNYNKL